MKLFSMSPVQAAGAALLLCVALGVVLPQPLHAQVDEFVSTEQHTVQTYIVQLLQLIAELQARLAELQAQASQQTAIQDNDLISINKYNGTYTAQQTDPEIDGKTTVRLTAPRSNSVFPWTGEEERFTVSWKIENAPENSVVYWETKADVLFNGSGVGGGGGHGEIPPGDSVGTRVHRYGPSMADPGEYKIRLTVRECHSKGCTVNPNFPGQEEDLDVYAQTAWRSFNIGDRDAKLYETNGEVTIEDIKPNSGTIYFNEPTKITFNLDGVPEGKGHQVCFNPKRKTTLGSYSVTDRCVTARNGRNTITWTPRTWMPADDYRLYIRVYDLYDGSGKDAGTLAQRRADWFTLTHKPTQPVSVPDTTTDSDDQRVSELPIIFTHPERGSTYEPGDRMLVSWDGTVWPTGIKLVNLTDDSHVFLRDALGSGGTYTFTLPREIQPGNYQLVAYTYGPRTAKKHVGASEPIKIVEKTEVADPQFHTAIGVGAYEGSYPDGVRHSFGYHPQGAIDVYIADGGYKTGTIVLALSAYEPVKWNIYGPGAHQIGQVYATGYHDQEVVGLAANVPVRIETHARGDDYLLAFRTNSEDYQQLYDEVKETYGVTIQQYVDGYSQEEVRFEAFKG